MTASSRKQQVPPRALAISLAALAIPVATVFWLPDWTSNGLGMLIWLTALIPAFLLSYYRGLQGVALALAGGMAVITATQIVVVAYQVADPNWTLLMAIVAIYLAVSLGIATLAEALRRERRAAEDLARIDQLTELPNRRHLEDALQREFAAAERGRGLAVVIFDLDRFKQVNDRHGHAAGDMALKAFANVLRTNTRLENLSARFGGEEFVALLRDTDADSAVLFAQRVLDQMRESPLPWGAQTVSAGVAEYYRGLGSYELLLGEADRALYQAKEGGRDMVCTAPRYEQPLIGQRPSGVVAASALPEEPPPEQPIVGRIWIVDDDAAVRSVVKRILIRDGHDLWDTGDPREAIRRFADVADAERPDIILTDVIMPEMSGMRMIDQIAKISADIKVIYMSGYVQSAIEWQGSPGLAVTFLAKPIQVKTLLDAVQRVIRSAPTSAPT